MSSPTRLDIPTADTEDHRSSRGGTQPEARRRAAPPFVCQLSLYSFDYYDILSAFEAVISTRSKEEFEPRGRRKTKFYIEFQFYSSTLLPALSTLDSLLSVRLRKAL